MPKKQAFRDHEDVGCSELFSALSESRAARIHLMASGWSIVLSVGLMLCGLSWTERGCINSFPGLFELSSGFMMKIWIPVILMIVGINTGMIWSIWKLRREYMGRSRVSFSHESNLAFYFPSNQAQPEGSVFVISRPETPLNQVPQGGNQLTNGPILNPVKISPSTVTVTPGLANNNTTAVLQNHNGQTVQTSPFNTAGQWGVTPAAAPPPMMQNHNQIPPMISPNDSDGFSSKGSGFGFGKQLQQQMNLDASNSGAQPSETGGPGPGIEMKSFVNGSNSAGGHGGGSKVGGGPGPMTLPKSDNTISSSRQQNQGGNYNNSNNTNTTTTVTSSTMSSNQYSNASGITNISSATLSPTRRGFQKKAENNGSSSGTSSVMINPLSQGIVTQTNSISPYDNMNNMSIGSVTDNHTYSGGSSSSSSSQVGSTVTTVSPSDQIHGPGISTLLPGAKSNTSSKKSNSIRGIASGVSKKVMRIWVNPDAPVKRKEGCYRYIQRRCCCLTSIFGCSGSSLSQYDSGQGGGGGSDGPKGGNTNSSKNFDDNNLFIAFWVRCYRWSAVWKVVDTITLLCGLTSMLAIFLTATLFPYHYNDELHVWLWGKVAINGLLSWIIGTAMFVMRTCPLNPFVEVLRNNEITNAQNYHERKTWLCGLIRFNIRVMDVSDPAAIDTYAKHGPNFRFGEMILENGVYVDLENQNQAVNPGTGTSLSPGLPPESPDGGQGNPNSDNNSSKFPPGSIVEGQGGKCYVVDLTDINTINQRNLCWKRFKKFLRLIGFGMCIFLSVFFALMVHNDYEELKNMRDCHQADIAKAVMRRKWERQGSGEDLETPSSSSSTVSQQQQQQRLPPVILDQPENHSLSGIKLDTPNDDIPWDLPSYLPSINYGSESQSDSTGSSNTVTGPGLSDKSNTNSQNININSQKFKQVQIKKLSAYEYYRNVNHNPNSPLYHHIDLDKDHETAKQLGLVSPFQLYGHLSPTTNMEETVTSESESSNNSIALRLDFDLSLNDLRSVLDSYSFQDYTAYCKHPTNCNSLERLQRDICAFLLAWAWTTLTLIPFEAETLGFVAERRQKRFLRKKLK